MLFNEPKLLKLRCPTRPVDVKRRFSALQRAEIAEMRPRRGAARQSAGFSALQRAEIAEIGNDNYLGRLRGGVSVLFNEPKLLKSTRRWRLCRKRCRKVSVLFNEPKLLKYVTIPLTEIDTYRFSALQRAEIAEIGRGRGRNNTRPSFSALQRAEIAEMLTVVDIKTVSASFSALQRAEIAEILLQRTRSPPGV